ncbi:hypothetical protein HOY82DRAFT_599209 [Tuber indicum]|nr:hypothetical protein HOY82DRAFT_599209 [Tuber indicum]
MPKMGESLDKIMVKKALEEYIAYEIARERLKQQLDSDGASPRGALHRLDDELREEAMADNSTKVQEFGGGKFHRGACIGKVPSGKMDPEDATSSKYSFRNIDKDNQQQSFDKATVSATLLVIESDFLFRIDSTPQNLSPLPESGPPHRGGTKTSLFIPPPRRISSPAFSLEVYPLGIPFPLSQHLRMLVISPTWLLLPPCLASAQSGSPLFPTTDGWEYG